MPIKNLSNIRRIPRLGKISLGIKKKTEKGVEYPSEVSYFVCPEKVQKIFGEKPTILRIMFPVEDKDIFFQQWYKSYGYDLLKCKGDGEKAFTWNEKEGGIKEIPCPCQKLEKGECRRIGILQFILPDVDGLGVWQISTSSRNSIIDLNSSIDLVKNVCGRVRMIPLMLKREEILIQRIEAGKPKKSKHYTLKLDVENLTFRQLQLAAQIPPEQVFLPPPDESKDELFYPENGFEAENKKEEIKENKAIDTDLLNATKQELSFLLEKYKKLGKMLTQDEETHLVSLADEDIEGRQKAVKYFKEKIEKLEKKNSQKGLFSK